MKKVFKGFVLLLMSSQVLLAQETEQQPYRNLVMEGGGIKGIAYGGALAELENNGILKGVTRVAGTSAGAIQACLLALGYSSQEITEIIVNTPVESFNDDGFVGYATKRLIKKYGWYKGDKFLKTLSGHIAKRTGNPNLTFEELHEFAKSYPFRDLYVVGTDLSSQSYVVFSHKNYPKMRIADAVRVSMSIPLYYEALWLNEKGEVIEDPKNCENCHLYADGGLLLNFPIDVFDHSDFINRYEGPPTKMFNPQTLGMRLERCEQIDHEQRVQEGIAPYSITNLGSYMSALSNVIMRNVNVPNPADVSRTIYINDQGMSPRIRKILPEEKDSMMLAGRQGVNEFIARSR